MSALRTAVDPTADAVGRPPRSARLASLDGLRGVAAVVVVLHHTFEVAAPHLRANPSGTGVGSLWWWVSESPLKLLTAGAEAVVLFFVLSGLVVALPALRGDRFSWSGFLASRVVRIMVPVWGALAVAVALLMLVPRDPARFPDGSWIVENNASTLSPSILLQEATLSRYSYSIDNVLWSLRWEMLFAVLLPVFVAAALAVRRHALLAAAGAFAVSVVGFALRDGTMSYLPAFFLGTLIAVRLDEVRMWGSEATRRPRFRALWLTALVVALLAMIAPWLARPVLGAGVLTEALRSLAVPASAALILLALVASPVARVLSGRVCAWLGRISFSVYLVHVPVLVTLSYLMGDANWKWVVLLAPVLGVTVGHLFWRVLERPAHRLARATGRWIGAEAERRRQSVRP